MTEPIRALVVGCSAAERVHVAQILQADNDISVVAQAATIEEALQQMRRHSPDVVVIDLTICAGTGATVERIAGLMPVPVVALSPRFSDGSSTLAAEALAAGALEVLPTPRHHNSGDAALIREAVRVLRRVVIIQRKQHQRVPQLGAGNPLVAIAASTGGPAALAEVVSGLGQLQAPVLIVQHLYPDFVPGFVRWLQRGSGLPVELARSNVTPSPGVVYVAPGGTHLKVGRYRKLVLDEMPKGPHQPSADELFASLAMNVGDAAVAVLLTGMGSDGATGLLAVRRAGGVTIAQDEATCAVFGMPKAAAELGAVDVLVPLWQIPAAIIAAVKAATRIRR